jgi:hypothetical protein
LFAKDTLIDGARSPFKKKEGVTQDFSHITPSFYKSLLPFPLL